MSKIQKKNIWAQPKYMLKKKTPNPSTGVNLTKLIKKCLGFRQGPEINSPGDQD